MSDGHGHVPKPPSPILVLAEGRDEWGEPSWFRLLVRGHEQPPDVTVDGVRVERTSSGLMVCGEAKHLRSWAARYDERIPAADLLATLDNLSRREFTVTGRSGTDLALGPTKPRIMAIVNLTPDSFSDGSSYPRVEDAVEAALRMEREGADILDLGAESSRPGAVPVSADEELRRLLPVLENLRPRTRLPISIDTTKAKVAQAALERGADWINDISALRNDSDMAALVRDSEATVVLMHMQGTPPTMQDGPSYDDCVAEVIDTLAARVEHARSAGIRSDRILVDPGLGFGKRLGDNLELVARLPALRALGFPVLLGASRKSFLGTVLEGSGRPPPPPGQRDVATLAVLACAHAAGVSVHRTHRVRYAREVLTTLCAIEGSATGKRGHEVGPGNPKREERLE